MVSIKLLIRSFKNALKGLRHVFKTEQNIRIQFLVGLVVFLLAILLPLQRWELIIIILLILLVLIMEILNTVLEYLNDLLKPRLHHQVHIIKDAMAGGVLLTTIISVIIGLIIFAPHFLTVLK